MTEKHDAMWGAEAGEYIAAQQAEIKRLRAALLVAQQWMPTPTQAIEDGAKRDVRQVYNALGWSVDEQNAVKPEPKRKCTACAGTGRSPLLIVCYACGGSGDQRDCYVHPDA